MTVEELNIVVSANDRKFNEAIDDVINRLEDLEEHSRESTDSIGGMFSKLGKIAAGLGLGKVIGDSIMSGGELEQQLGGVEVVFRKHADSMKKAASTAFEDMGLSESDYLAKANKMGALLKGSGFDTGYAADMSQRVMQRASDVASIMGVDVKDAMEAVTGAAKGNFTMMDNLGVAMNDTTLQAYAQEKGLGKLETTQQKVSAAMQMFLDKTEYAAGNYARENDTFSGSLTTAKAQLDNLTADLGTRLLPTATTLVTMARDGLGLISPLVTSLGEGLNSAGQYLLNMSPSAKTMLGIAVGAAVAIPAATKAQALWKAVNAGWSAVLDVLIPKEVTRATILKATAGWLVIIAGLLAVVASVGATAREMSSGEGAAMEETAAGAGKAAESTDDLSDSMANLGKSSDATKKKLADIDTLNIFDSGSSTGGIDFSAITDSAGIAKDSVAGLTDGIDEASLGLDELNGKTKGFSLGNIGDTFRQTFSDIGTGFSTMIDAFNFDSDTQLTSLRVLDYKIRALFGDDWSDFWTNVGSTMYRAFGENNSEYDRFQALSDIEGWLNEINEFLTGWMGEFGDAWSEFWEGIGHSFNAGKMEQAAADSQKYSSLYADISNALVDYLRQGNDEDTALKLAKDKYLGEKRDTDAARYYREQGYDEQLNYLYAHELKELLEESGQLTGAGYEYADHTAPQSGIPQGIYSGGAMTGPVQLPDVAASPQIIEFHNYIDLDGRVIGESVTQYQNGEQTRSNGY